MTNKTVGTGGDYATWYDAMTWLNTYLATPPMDDITITQISDVTETSFSPAVIRSLNGYTLTITSNSPHHGRPDTGWKTTINNTHSNSTLMLLLTNGVVEIENLHFYGAAVGWKAPVKLTANSGCQMLIHDIIVYSDVLPASGNYAAFFLNAGTGCTGFEVWNCIADILANGSTRPFWLDVDEDMNIENCVAQVRNDTASTIGCFERQGGTGKGYFRNCVGISTTSDPSISGFRYWTATNGDGDGNAAWDASADDFGTLGLTYYNNIVPGDEFEGTDYSDSDTYFVPRLDGSLGAGGVSVLITDNVEDIRGLSRPLHGYYSVGPAQLLDVEKTVGSGGDYATWKDALEDLTFPLTVNWKFEQISDVTETAPAALGATLNFGTCTVEITSDTPHEGRPDTGWETEVQHTGVLFDFNEVQSGTLEVHGLRIVPTVVGHKPAINVDAGSGATVRLYDLIWHSTDGNTPATGAINEWRTNGNDAFEVWNVIMDLPGPPAGTLHFVEVSLLVGGDRMDCENMTLQRRAGASAIVRGIAAVSVASGATLYVRNVAVLSFDAGFYAMGTVTGQTTGYTNASTDSTANSFKTVVGYYNVIVAADEFLSLLLADPANWMAPDPGETVYDGGSAPAIFSNTEGIRENARPKAGVGYAVGAAEQRVYGYFIEGSAEGTVLLSGTVREVPANRYTPEDRADALGYRASTPLIVQSLDIEDVSGITAAQVPENGHFAMSMSFLGGPGDPLYDQGARPGSIGTKVVDGVFGTYYVFREPLDWEVVWHVEITLDGDRVDHGLYRWQTGSDLHWAPYKSWPERALIGQRVFDALDPDKVYDYYARLVGACMTQWNADNTKLLDFIDPDACPSEFLLYLARNLGLRLRPGETTSTRRTRIKNAIPISKEKGLPLAVVIRLQELGYEGYAREIWVNPDNPTNYEDDTTGEKGTDFVEVAHGSRRDDIFIGYRFLDAVQPSDGETVTIGDYTTTVVFEFESGGGVTPGNTAVTIGADVWETLDNLIAAVNASALTVAAREDVQNEVEPTMLLDAGTIRTDARHGWASGNYWPSSRVSLHVNHLSGEPIDLTRSEASLDELKEEIARELGLDVFPVYTDIRYFATDVEVGESGFGLGEELEIEDALVLTEV
jgi:hypothetical protein